MIAHVTIPIFSSPTNPIGTSEGQISLERLPTIGESLAWTELKKAGTSALVAALNTGRVDYIDTSPKIKSVDLVVGLDGVYLDSETAAREIALELESRFGLVYVDY